MLKAKNNVISMVEGDFGLSLPITISGTTINDDETLIFYIKKNDGTDLISPKEYTKIQENTFDLFFSKEETEKMKVGTYLYYLDWYKKDEFLGSVINGQVFKVEGK